MGMPLTYGFQKNDPAYSNERNDKMVILSSDAFLTPHRMQQYLNGIPRPFIPSQAVYLNTVPTVLVFSRKSEEKTATQPVYKPVDSRDIPKLKI
jgi:hypothetical protein